MTIKLTIAGKEVELTEAEARALWAELDSVFASRESLPLPVFIPTYRQPPIYQPLPYYPNGPTCGTPVAGGVICRDN